MRDINIGVILWLLLCLSVNSYSQMVPMENRDAFLKMLEKNTGSVKSIESNFEQVKHIDIFNDDVTSKGTFYYQSPDKIAMNYANPVKYSMIINGDQLKTVSNGKISTISLSNNKMMKELQTMISACMTGDISALAKGYKVGYFEDENGYFVTLEPESAAIKSYITGFRIYFDKKSVLVERLRIDEGAEDYTEYKFSGQKVNTAINGEIFK